MKPVQVEKQWLRDYLYQVIEYKETFEKVYNNILTALKQQPEEQQFELAVSSIIERDFGGNDGLISLEALCRETAEENARRQHWVYFKQWFSSKYAVITLATFALLFWLQHYKHIFAWMPVVFFVLFFIPLVWAAKYWITANYTVNSGKRSIRDEVFVAITFKNYFSLFKFIVVCNITIVIVEYVFNIGPLTAGTANKSTLPPNNLLVFNIISCLVSAVFLLIVTQLLTTIQLRRFGLKTEIVENQNL